MPRAEQFDLPRRFARWVPPIITELVVALAMIALAIGSHLAIDLFFKGIFSALIFPAIAGAVLLAGPRSGAIVLIGCQLLAWYFLLPIQGSFRFESWDNVVRLVLNLIAALILLWAVSSYRKAARAAAAAEAQRAEGLKESADRMAVLVAEVQHRTRNLIAIVQSIADKTLLHSDSAGDFAAKFRARLSALARVQSLLSGHTQADLIPFDELLSKLLFAHIGLDPSHAQVTLDGPRGVCLHSKTIQTFALVLHELSTNAVKYGALAQPTARLALRWHVEPANDPGRQQLCVAWRESGVAMPEAGMRTGYGRELIERALPYQFRVETNYELTADGVHCTFCLPTDGNASA